MTRRYRAAMVAAVAGLALGSPARAHVMHHQSGQTWTTWNVPFKGGSLRVIVPKGLTGEQARIRDLVMWADRSMVTTDPLREKGNGFIKPGDVMVATNSLLLWFDATNEGSLTTNGGGGLLRGLWTLRRDESNHLNFRRIVNPNNYAPNLLLVGSTPGQQGSGISLLGNYGDKNVDNGITWAIEHEAAPTTTSATGKSVRTVDSGKYADRDGVFVQFTGRIANSPGGRFGAGIDSHYDVDFRPGSEGRARYTLTYRIPAIGDEFRQEIALRGEQGQFGPLATIVLSHNVAGYDGQTIHYVSDPALNGDYITQGKITRDPTNYFTLPGLSLKFYAHPWSADHPPVLVQDTPPGTGKLLGIGGPSLPYPAPFFAFRPDAASLPADLRPLYSLQAIDNRATNIRSNAADWQLFDVNRGHPARTYGVGQGPDIVTDYLLL